MRLTLVGLFMVGACHGGGPQPNQIDAPGSDADTSPDSNLGVASVLVQSSKRPSPVVGAPVLFTDASGASSEAHTDAMGRANGLIPPGGSVTTELSETHFVTIADAMPGDHLTFGLGRFHDAGNVTVAFTAYDPSATYRLYSPCLSVDLAPPTTTVSLELCNGPISDTDVFIVAVTPTTTVTAGAHHVDLTSGAILVTEAWTPFRAIQASYTGISPQELAAYSYDVPEGYGSGGSLVTPSVTLMVPATVPTQLIRTDVELVTSDPTQRSQSVVDRIAPAVTTYALSSADLRPQITSVAYDAATRTVSSTAPAALAGDIVIYELIWGTSSAPCYWEIYAPRFEPFTLPALPPDMLDLPTVCGHPPTTGVTLYDDSSVTSWDDARGRVFDLTSGLPLPANVPDRLYQQSLVIRN